ncbi:MAG: MFS transporter [Anaerolineae bacterium]
MSTLVQPTLSDKGRSAQWAVAMLFFVYGTRMSTWFMYIPALPDRFSLSESELGLLFLVASVGAFFAVVRGGVWTMRVGSQALGVFWSLAFCLIVPGMILIDSLPVFVVLYLIYGVGAGMADIAMNTQGVAVQHYTGRAVLSRFHGIYSVGMLVGAGTGTLAIASGVPPAVHMMAVFMPLALLVMFNGRDLIPHELERGSTTPQTSGFMIPRGVLLWIGLLVFAAYFSEETVVAWSGIYLQDTLHAAPAVVPLGYLAFALMMTTGRMFGDWLTTRYAPETVVRYSALTASVGLALGLMIPHPGAAIIGFGCAGLGVANLAPVLLSAAGRMPGLPSGVAVSAVSSVGYLAFFIGPPIVGFVAEATSLAYGIGVMVLVGLMTAACAGIIRR